MSLCKCHGVPHGQPPKSQLCQKGCWYCTFLIVFKSAKEFDEAGSTAVHKAAANGHLDVLKLLIQHGGDVELADISGCTPLHVAARNGHLTCVKYLVLQGADFRMKSKKGNTAMVMAKANNQPKVAEYLSNCGELKNDQFQCNKWRSHTIILFLSVKGFEKVYSLTFITLQLAILF